ncbi:MAG: flagellar biosynthetic protein FliO [Spirochaetia bacterium]
MSASEESVEGNEGARESVDESSLSFGEDTGEDEQGEEQPTSINSFGVWDFVRMIVVLGIVIGAIYVVFYLLKRASGGRLENSPVIRVLGSHALPGNKALHLVEVGRQVFLIGVGDDSPVLISEISDQESLDELRLNASTTASENRGSFADMLSGFFHSGGAGASGGTSGGTGEAAGAGGTSRSPDSNGNGNGSPVRGSNGGGESRSPFFESQKERLRKLR